jgi:hypothetical protein
MAYRVTIDPIDRQVKLIIDQFLSPSARSEQIATLAGKALAEADQVNAAALGYVPRKLTTVDGVADAPLDTVNPDTGEIIRIYDLLTEVFRWIDQMLTEHSPVKSGRYEKSHRLFADGVEADVEAPPPAGEYVFLNIQPYARKIERGESPQAPEGVYEGVASMAQSRFSNIASIRFTYREGAGDVAEWAAGKAARHPSRRPKRQHARDTSQPAIVITPADLTRFA